MISRKSNCCFFWLINLLAIDIDDQGRPEMVYLSIVDDFAVVHLVLEPRWVYYFDSGFYRECLPKNSHILARLVEFQPFAI